MNPEFNKLTYNNKINDYIRKEIIIGSKLIVLGYYAFNYYKYKSLNKSEDLYVPYYDVISTNYVNDVDNIFNNLKKNFKDKPLIKDYHPFYQFTGKKTSFMYNDKVVLNIYNNNERCIPYKYIEPKILMSLLIAQSYYFY